MNSANFGVLVGRLTRDVEVRKNSDGSAKAFVNIAVDDNFKSGQDKEYHAQFINAEGFISKDKKNLGVYEYMKKGTLVSLAIQLKNDQYLDKDNKQQYRQYVFITDVKLLASPKGANGQTAVVEETVEDEPLF